MALTSPKMQRSLITFLVFLWISIIFGSANGKEENYNNLDIKENDLPQSANPRQYPPYYGNGGPGYAGNAGGGNGCPLCDSSVYSYCSQKIIHDSCCCDFPVSQLKPQQCYYYDCSLLYAKSCYEHSLIKNCCCNSPY